MALIDLPSELLDAICSQCDPADVPNLRLTSRAVNASASAFLLPFISTLFHRAGLDRLCQLADFAPGIRTGVKELIFHVDAYDTDDIVDLPSWDDERQKAWRQQRSHVSSKLRTNTSLSSYMTPLPEKQRRRLEEITRVNEKLRSEGHRLVYPESYSTEEKLLLEKHYAIFESLLDDQKALIDEHTVRERMTTVFQACPKLTQVHFKVRIGGTLGCCDEAFHRALYVPDGGTSDSGQAVLQTLLAVNSAKRHLTSVRVDEIEHTDLLNVPDEIAAELSQVLETVEDLHWEFGRMFAHCEMPIMTDLEMYFDIVEEFDVVSLVELLRMMPNLKSLHIPIRLPEEFPSDELVTLDRLVGDHHWLHLSHVSMSAFKATADQLQAFLLRHKDTLQTIEIGDAYLTEGEWDQLFMALAGQFPKLEEFYLYNDLKAASGRYYHSIEDHEASFSRYLVSGGSLPRKPRRLGAGGDPATAGGWDLVFGGETEDETDDSDIDSGGHSSDSEANGSDEDQDIQTAVDDEEEPDESDDKR